MLVYIADRHGKIISTAANDLPANKTLINDTLTDDIETGVKTLELTFEATEDLRDATSTGNYILYGDCLFSIITSTFSTFDNTIDLYCEDLGLDFLNRVVGKVKKTSGNLSFWVERTLGTSASSGWKYRYACKKSVKNANKTLEYTEDATATQRLLDILDNYDLEMYFTYTIDGFKWIKRTVNFIEKRGNNKKRMHRLYIDKEVRSITKTESIENLATVWRMYGKDGKSLVNLTGYKDCPKSYAKTSSRKHTYNVVNEEVRCVEAIKKNKSKLDKDGKIVQVIYTEYTDAQRCINYALKYMEKIVDPVTTYEVDLVNLPDGIECGDYVYILDAHDNILLSARVLKWSKSECLGKCECELGDFTKVKSSMADIEYNKIKMYTISITSSNGLTSKPPFTTTLSATVNLNGSLITSIDELPDQYELEWYKNNVKVTNTDTSKTPCIEDDGFTLVTGTITSKTNYSCKLVEKEDAQ